MSDDGGFILCYRVGRLTSVVREFEYFEDLCSYATAMNGVGMLYEDQYVFYKVGNYLLRSPYTVFRLSTEVALHQCRVDK